MSNNEHYRKQALSMPEAAPIAAIVNASGVFPVTTASSAHERLAASAFCWLDIFGGDDTERKALLALIGLEETDLVWLQRFGQAGRLTIGQKRLRAVTWMAEPAGKLIEVHLLCSHQRILTVWRGDVAILDNLRQHFVERVGEVGKSPFQATGILLQLLLSTLDHAIRSLDTQLDHLRAQLDDRTTSADYARFASQHKELQTAWLGFDRYASAVPHSDGRHRSRARDGPAWRRRIERLRGASGRRPRTTPGTSPMDVGYRARRSQRAYPAAGRADKSADIGIVDLSSGHSSDWLFRDELQLDDKCARW